MVISGMFNHHSTHKPITGWADRAAEGRGTLAAVLTFSSMRQLSTVSSSNRTRRIRMSEAQAFKLLSVRLESSGINRISCDSKEAA